MHKLVINNHRGVCEVNYCDFISAIDLVKINSPSLAIIDKNIKKLYPSLIDDFSFIDKKIIMDSGESTKTLSGVFNLLEEINKLNIYPINHILVIGGGTLQDTCGTAISLLKRGTDWSFIPSTLLAQADSCIGSKTSINSSNTKNLYGVFYSPKKIYIVAEFLSSLPELEIISGIGDALHYLLLNVNETIEYSMNLLEYIIINGASKFTKDKKQVLLLSEKVHHIKKYFIETDEFDTSERKVLNLGHSFGHALEAFLEYEIPHGIGVLFGLILAIDFSKFLFKCKDSKQYENLKLIKSNIYKLLEIYSPIKPEIVSSYIKSNQEGFLGFLSRDKKNTTYDAYNLVLFKNETVQLVDIEKKMMIKYLDSI